MKQLQKGFTLIELMIVVTIIGILAAIALPAYQGYVARTQVTEAFNLLGGLKTPQAEYCSQTGGYSSDLAIFGATTAGKYVKTVVATTAGLMTATMKSTGVNTDLQGATLTLSSTLTDCGKTWACGGTIPAKHRPQACQ